MSLVTSYNFTVSLYQYIDDPWASEIDMAYATQKSSKKLDRKIMTAVLRDDPDGLRILWGSMEFRPNYCTSPRCCSNLVIKPVLVWSICRIGVRCHKPSENQGY